VSESATSFAYHVHKLHKEISTPIQKRNANYKVYADLFKRAQDFNVRDYVMVRIRPKQYPSGTVKKLHGPFKILRSINSNAYIVDFSPDFGISPVNIEDLVACKGPIFSSDKSLVE